MRHGARRAAGRRAVAASGQITRHDLAHGTSAGGSAAPQSAFQDYLTRFGEIQKLARGILEKVAAAKSNMLNRNSTPLLPPQ